MIKINMLNRRPGEGQGATEAQDRSHMIGPAYHRSQTSRAVFLFYFAIFH